MGAPRPALGRIHQGGIVRKIQGFLLLLPLLTAGCLLGCDQLSTAVTSTAGKLDLTFSVTQSLPTSFDLGQALGGNAGQVAPVALAQDVTSPAQTVDLTKTEPQLVPYKKLVKSIKITAVTVTPKSNTLTGPLPQVDLYVGATPLKATKDGARLCSIPSIPKGSVAAVTGTVDAASAAAASTFVTSLAFDELSLIHLVVAKGETAPAGKIDLDVKVTLSVVVSPL